MKTNMVRGEEGEGGYLIIEKSLKSAMLRNIKRIKRYARVHISPFSPSLEMAIFYGRHNDIESAITEFLGKFFLNASKTNRFDSITSIKVSLINTIQKSWFPMTITWIVKNILSLSMILT